MKAIAPLDMLFLLMEGRAKPAHVGGLQLFQPPEGVEPSYLRSLYEHAIESDGPLRPVFRRKVRGLSSMPLTWGTDADFDIEYHVRHSGLPHPGRIRELLALVSRLHGTLLDRNRPLWESHLIEGLTDGRFALYTKIHHALVDGVSAMRLMQDALTDDPDATDLPYPWQRRIETESTRPARRPSMSLGDTVVRELGGLPAIGMGAVQAVLDGFADEASTLPVAPKTMFNVPVTGSRRFAADSWALDRIKSVGSRTGATVNDVVLAMTAGALRRYLSDQNALPDQSLTAMVPVSLKTRNGDNSDSGNAVGSILCTLGTHLDHAGDRLELIQQSMAVGKRRFEGMTPTQVMMMSALAMSPAALSMGPLGKLALTEPFLRPPFNLVISNVPGPRTTQYFNGSRMEGMYPVSVVTDGQALNVTVTSYADSIDFGIIGCRRAVPHLQRLLDHLDTELKALESF